MSKAKIGVSPKSSKYPCGINYIKREKKFKLSLFYNGKKGYSFGYYNSLEEAIDYKDNILSVLNQYT